MLKSKLQEWFAERPAISTRRFAIECGYTEGGRFQRWIKRKPKFKELVSDKVQRKIMPLLVKYGWNDPISVKRNKGRVGFDDLN